MHTRTALYETKQSMGRTLDRVVTAALAALRSLRAVRRGVEELNDRMEKLEKQVQVLSQHIGGLNNSIQTLCQRKAVNPSTANVGDQNRDEQFESRIVEPMVRHLCLVIDTLDDLETTTGRGNGQRRADVADAARTQVTDFLGVYGIEVIAPRQGSAFNAKWMRPVKVETTRDPNRHMRVRACVRRACLQGKRVLRPASVVILKHQHDSTGDLSNATKGA